VSYSIQPGRLLLADVQDLSITEVRAVVWPLLETEGFEDLGLDEEMIELLGLSESNAESLDSFRAHLLREYTYLNERRDLRVVVTDWTDPTIDHRDFQFSAPEGAFFEITIYEQRPGGFSLSGHEFFLELAAELQDSLPVKLMVATAPPETNNGEYWAITLAYLSAGAIFWLIPFGFGSAFVSFLLVILMSRAPERVWLKRTIFVIGNTWLATPFPFPAASVLVILLPHAFAFPWNDWQYYDRVIDFAVYSFPISLLLSFLLSLGLFRGIEK